MIHARFVFSKLFAVLFSSPQPNKYITGLLWKKSCHLVAHPIHKLTWSSLYNDLRKSSKKLPSQSHSFIPLSESVFLSRVNSSDNTHTEYFFRVHIVKHIKASSQGPEAYNAFKHAACKLTEFYNETKGQSFQVWAINMCFLFRSQNKRKSLWIYGKGARANQMGQITKEARYPPWRSNCQYNRFFIQNWTCNQKKI